MRSDDVVAGVGDSAEQRALTPGARAATEEPCSASTAAAASASTNTTRAMWSQALADHTLLDAQKHKEPRTDRGLVLASPRAMVQRRYNFFCSIALYLLSSSLCSNPQRRQRTGTIAAAVDQWAQTETAAWCQLNAAQQASCSPARQTLQLRFTHSNTHTHTHTHFRCPSQRTSARARACARARCFLSVQTASRAPRSRRRCVATARRGTSPSRSPWPPDCRSSGLRTQRLLRQRAQPHADPRFARAQNNRQTDGHLHQHSHQRPAHKRARAPRLSCGFCGFAYVSVQKRAVASHALMSALY